MADDEAIFDPSLKKKKKKKIGFNIEAAMAETAAAAAEEPSSPHENGVTETKEESLDVDDLELPGKKMKKKKKTFSLDGLKNALPDAGKEGDEGEEGTGGGMLPVQDMDEFDMDFSKQAKKKKKKPQKRGGLDELLADEVGKDDLENNQAEEYSLPEEEKESGDGWYDSDRDYTYDELLQRAFNQLRERNPDMATGEKKKFVMKPPQVVRIGSKKSAFANFTEICRLLHRIPKHLLQFLLAELGTSGSIDGNNQLIIKGRFQQKQIENVLRRYIKEYVTCHTCRSPDTILQKDARLYFLQCEQCNSRCSVAPIKSGFQAVANKQQRQAIRASKN
ncbi:UNVERIFIED_CONTAM: hypothetical protein RMT77_004013 [Armadillidium vulgare]